MSSGPLTIHCGHDSTLLKERSSNRKGAIRSMRFLLCPIATEGLKALLGWTPCWMALHRGALSAFGDWLAMF
jgi:hypothetical protein